MQTHLKMEYVMPYFFFVLIALYTPLSFAQQHPITTEQCYLLVDEQSEKALSEMSFRELQCGYYIADSEFAEKIYILSRYNYLKDSPREIHAYAFVNIFLHIERGYTLNETIADYITHLLGKEDVQELPFLVERYIAILHGAHDSLQRLREIDASWMTMIGTY